MRELVPLLKSGNPCGKENRDSDFLGFFHREYFLFEICNGRLGTVGMLKDLAFAKIDVFRHGDET